MNIAEYDALRHETELRNCVIELQDFEQAIDDRLPGGAAIIDDYMLQMSHRCRQCDGAILVAEDNDTVAGYVLVLTRVQGDGVEDGDLEYALVADLIVRRQSRRSGVGRGLLDAAERYARARGADWLRIGAMAGNRGALRLYESLGFNRVHIELEKDLRP